MLSNFYRRFAAPFFALTLSMSTVAPLWADGTGIMIDDPYARAATPAARSGAAFMVIMNHTGIDDRLIAASTDVAKRVELHTHTADDAGVMRMREVEGGIMVPAGEATTLKRGGLHVMMMGLTERFDQGKEIDVTLTFERAGEIVVKIPVDNERAADHGGMHHGAMGHGTQHGAKSDDMVTGASDDHGHDHSHNH